MNFTTIRYERDGAVGWLWLNRPDKHNAQNSLMSGEIIDLMNEITEEGTLRVLVVSGAGERAFSAGADLGDLGAVGGPSGAHIEAVARLPIPTIAAIRGHCLGGGLELALACDIRIAATGAGFGFPEVGLGLIPAWGGTQRLPRVVGPAAAKELIYTAQRITAEQALAIGLINRLVAPDRLVDEANALAAEIAANGPLALRYAKEAIHEGLDLTLAQGLELEGDLYVLLESTEDRKEGITAFREKRRPVWSGR